MTRSRRGSTTSRGTRSPTDRRSQGAGPRGRAGSGTDEKGRPLRAPLLSVWPRLRRRLLDSRGRERRRSVVVRGMDSRQAEAVPCLRMPNCLGVVKGLECARPSSSMPGSARRIHRVALGNPPRHERGTSPAWSGSSSRSISRSGARSAKVWKASSRKGRRSWRRTAKGGHRRRADLGSPAGRALPDRGLWLPDHLCPNAGTR